MHHFTMWVMLEKFKAYIRSNNLTGTGESLLLGVSGGIDSMTMLHLFLGAGYKPAIAHCNFKLRTEESDNDQKFVAQFAEENKLRFFTRDFEAKAYAEEKRLSIQMAARELRYSWFHELAEKNGYTKIAVAHNRDDLVETFLINLTRGTGIHGLTGIKPSTGKIIRPLLFAGRSEIEKYAAEFQIAYREDSSNAETKYLRNKIRHQIVPLFKSLNPSFSDTIAGETEILQSVENLYRQRLDDLKEKILIVSEDEIRLNIALISKEQITVPLLFDLLENYRFSYGTVRDIWNSLDNEPGKIFHSSTHVAVKDRTDLIIRKITEMDDQTYLIYPDTKELTRPLSMRLNLIDHDPWFVLRRESSNALLDLDKLSFPLQLRHWNEGDFFYPLGLNGKKKLSDFFVDKKMNKLDKHKCWILTSGQDIVWIVGQQIDDRFKISGSTRKVLQIELIN